MNILITVIGCILGVAIYIVLSPALPFHLSGDYAVGFIVAFCLITIAALGYIPWFSRKP